MGVRLAKRGCVIAASLAFTLVLGACGPPPPSSPAADDLVARHAALRSERGLPVETRDQYATDNAQFHADRLAARATNCSSLWHSPELGSWYTGRWAAENVACVTGCPADAAVPFWLWAHSPGHFANLVNPSYGVIGVGVSCSGSVQMFVAQYASP